MHPHEHHPLLKPSDLLIRHFRNLCDGSAKELLPGPLAPEQFAWCDATCFVDERADDSGIEVELEWLGAVLAGDFECVCVGWDTAAVVESGKLAVVHEEIGGGGKTIRCTSACAGGRASRETCP
jgi:hypothetical protein